MGVEGKLVSERTPGGRRWRGAAVVASSLPGGRDGRRIGRDELPSQRLITRGKAADQFFVESVDRFRPRAAAARQ